MFKGETAEGNKCLLVKSAKVEGGDEEPLLDPVLRSER